MRTLKYRPAQCDVHDATGLREFRRKRKEWLKWLDGDKKHAIADQIANLLWSDAVFRLINSSRKIAAENGGNFAVRNGDLAGQANRGFVLEQLVGLRRLMEEANPNPKKQVVTFKRLFDEVFAHKHLFTREIFVSFDGLPYDYEAVQQQWLSSYSITSGSNLGVETNGPNAWATSDRKHREFDKYSGVTSAARSRADQISDLTFQSLERMISKAPFEKLAKIVNKAIAHAAAPNNRPATAFDNPVLGDIWKCHKALVQATHLIAIVFVQGSGPGGVPTPQYDVLENWDSPYIPANKRDELLLTWRAENDERSEWTYLRDII